MTSEQKAAYVNAQMACALIEMEGMKAANAQHPEAQPHAKEDFDKVILKYGIHHNGVVTVFNEW